MTAPAEIDPFAESADKAPAISFKNAPEGTIKTVKVTAPPKKIQGKEFGTENPATWPDGKPKYSAVINGLDENGEPCSVWAQIPSDLFIKLRDAQKELGRSVRDGDTIAIKFVKEEPTKGSPKKVYAVKITPGTPNAPAGSDPFGDSSSGAAKDGGADWGDAAPPW